MNLPEAFKERMKKQRPDDYEAFFKSLDEGTYHGLRVNTLKIQVDRFLELFPYKLTPVPWTEDGFYYKTDDPVTKHPYFHAGLYYIQEPSAMSPVGTWKLKEGDFCLDLCAAPGGKSLQMATGISDKGLLVTNDISDKRVSAIVRNVERFGLRNVIVLNEAPERIEAHFGAFFDQVLVDAPCSGEGMFRKDPKAVGAWAVYENDKCAVMQRDILDHTRGLLKTEGVLTYSTCTFAPDENEGQMQAFLEKDHHFQPLAMSNDFENMGMEVDDYQLRLLPHKLKGEGHYIARLRCISAAHKSKTFEKDESVTSKPPQALVEFMKTHLKQAFEGSYKVMKDRVHLMPEVNLPTQGLKVAREGVYLGDIKGKNFVPSQAMALYLRQGEFKQVIELPSDSLEIIKYLKCETLHLDQPGKGLHLVTTDGFPVGFCKMQNGMLKNLYPASWRMF